MWLTAGPDCIRLNHKLPTHPHICIPPSSLPISLFPLRPLPISISLSLYSPIFHSLCIPPAPPLLFLPSSNHYSLFFAPLISLTLPVLYNMNASLLRGLLQWVWTAGHVGECLLVWCVVWSYSLWVGMLQCGTGLHANVNACEVLFSRFAVKIHLVGYVGVCGTLENLQSF